MNSRINLLPEPSDVILAHRGVTYPVVLRIASLTVHLTRPQAEQLFEQLGKVLGVEQGSEAEAVKEGAA